jgi:DNA gyrase subunit A
LPHSQSQPEKEKHTETMTIHDVSFRQESRDRYLTYALSVVTGRALPDVRDGLKPVQRRILYAMYHNLGLKPTSAHRKSAAVVGEVLARFHPHGDSACYEAMVRMAQDFSLRYPLVDGQGNFGSMDGDNAAAYRYTEAKLLPIALEVLGEIDEDTVNFQPNFDSTVEEPVVLPSRIPNMLINGVTGIAVGMATSIPPHNLRDVVGALLELSKDPELATSRLVTLIKGPDFPTGCLVLNTRQELVDIYKTGRGSIKMRGEWKVEEGPRGKEQIVITSVPYAVNKAQLVEKIAQCIISKKVPQLVDVRDESTTDVRVVLELSPGANAEAAVAYLYKNTTLENNFSVNLTALVPTEKGALKPELLSLKECLQHFLNFRYQVVQRRLEYERRILKERIHILEGLMKVFDSLDEAIRIVRKSSGRSDAAEKLRKRFKLSEKQSFAVVDMRIYQLSRTSIEEIRDELEKKSKRVDEINRILKSKTRIKGLVCKDLEAVAQEYGDNRRSKIVKEIEEVEFSAADYLVREEVYAIVTADGWLKRIRQTNELGSTRVREGDKILRAHPVSTLDSVAFITNLGYLYVLDVTEFPSSSGYGTPIQKILKFKDGERVVESYGVVWDYESDEPAQESLIDFEAYPFFLTEGDELVFVSEHGLGFAFAVSELDGLKKNGKRVMKLRDGDKLSGCCHLDSRIAMATEQGSALSISSKDVPVRSAAAVGVMLMSIRKGDRLMGAVSFKRSADLVYQLDNGKSKSIKSTDLQTGRRGLKGKKLPSRGQVVSFGKETK